MKIRMSIGIAVLAFGFFVAGCIPSLEDLAPPPKEIKPMNILLTNDDGFESPNTRALYTALVAEGHNVIASVPYFDNSGRSGAVDLFDAIEDVESDGDTLPGVGVDPDLPNFYYVNTTPVGAVLHGIDVVALEEFGGKPDLVISGPNDGPNMGIITSTSGTVNAAISASQRGIPAIAVSTHFIDTRAGQSPQIAALTVRLLRGLQRNGLNQGSTLLPNKVALNVNFPSLVGRTPASVPFVVTQVSNGGFVVPKFYADLGQSRSAVGQWVAQHPENTAENYPNNGKPGMSAESPFTDDNLPQDSTTPSGPDNDRIAEHFPWIGADSDPVESDGSEVAVVSPLQSSYAGSEAQRIHFRNALYLYLE